MCVVWGRMLLIEMSLFKLFQGLLESLFSPLSVCLFAIDLNKFWPDCHERKEEPC